MSGAITPRDAAIRLATPEGAEDAATGLEPAPKRLIAALIEQAFDATPRGLAYPEELQDLERFLLGNAVVHDEDSDLRLLATAGAWVATRNDDPERPPRVLPLVRAIAAYFVQVRAGTLADVMRDDAKHAIGAGGAS